MGVTERECAVEHLDRLRQVFKLAEEEYTQMLEEYECRFGEEWRKQYEEQHA